MYTLTKICWLISGVFHKDTGVLKNIQMYYTCKHKLDFVQGKILADRLLFG